MKRAISPPRPRQQLPLARAFGMERRRAADNAGDLFEAVRDRRLGQQLGKVNMMHRDVAAELRRRPARAVFEIGDELAARDRQADGL